jgi:S-disulfanyl-L-cysteine oxidoreductase SoxD
MSTELRAGLLAVPLLVFVATNAGAAPPASPNLGRPPTPAEVSAADITVMADGEGLPPGSGTAKQGKVLYQAQCIVCHGVDGTSGPNLADRLAGGQGTLATEKPMKTIGSYWPYAPPVFDYIRRAMPYTAPRTLTNEQVYQLTAYILFLNGLVKEDDVINKESLSKIVMPNRNGFINALTAKPR